MKLSESAVTGAREEHGRQSDTRHEVREMDVVVAKRTESAGIRVRKA